MAVLVAACSVTQSTSPTATPTPKPLPTATSTPPRNPTSTSTRLPAPTRRPTFTPTSPATNSPTRTPLPTVAWTLPAIEIDGWLSGAYATWESNLSIRAASFPTTIYVDALSGRVTSVATATPFPEGLYRGPPSAKSAHFEITCSEGDLQLHRLPERTLLGEAPILVSYCNSVQWARDESAASIVSDDGSVFVWRRDGTAPYVVGQALPTTLAPWSPDSSRLLLTGHSDSSVLGEATFNIAYPDGRPMLFTGATIEAGNGWEPEFLHWLTDDLIANHRQCGDAGDCLFTSIYDATTGEYVAGYLTHSGFGVGQGARLSPNSQWLALDTPLDTEDWSQRFEEGYDEYRFLALLDVTTRNRYVWAEGKIRIVFSGWTSDSGRFYFLHYPSSSLDVGEPALSYGLLSLDPLTLQTTVVTANVVWENWSPDHSLIFVATAAVIGPDRAESVHGAIRAADGTPLTPPQFIAASLDLTRPYAQLVSASWSHTSNQLAVADGFGNLWLFSDNGQLMQLASLLPTVESPSGLTLDWSPDDRRLLVQSGDRAWVVTINTP